MASLLINFLTLLRPREGWVPFLLTLTALLCPAAALLTGDDEPAALGLVALTALAAIVGLRLARSRLRARQAAIAGGLLGLILTIIIVGRLLPPFSLLWTEVSYAADWLIGWRQGQIRWPLPFASAVGFAGQQLSALGIRLWWWGQAVDSGAQTQGNVVFLLLMATLFWALALLATWQIYRHSAALAGLLPGGAAMALMAFFRGGIAIFYLLVHLFCTLWLVAICHLWTNQRRWEESDTDYPDSLGMELIFALGPWLVLVLLLATFIPSVHSNRLREGFWQVMDAPWSRVERVAERLFGPVEGGYGGRAGTASGPGGELPRSHLLGGGPELGETIVLYVSADDPPPPRPAAGESEGLEVDYPRRYWRSQTYDLYTGLGWSHGSLESQPLSPNQFLETQAAPGSDLFQQFQRMEGAGTKIYAANTPYRVDQPVLAWWRAPDDLAYLTGEADLYTVLSRVPQPTIVELQASSPLTAPIVAEVANRYLVLPDSLPQRVRDLARQVTGDAPTRYDQVRALERFLRAYPYTLDLPDPPQDRDLVDYFLFELQEGYCDYYASAMVVMARAVGVPARLATGYAQGTYDYEARRWVVTEQNGHSWVEVYFDGIGWVEFEPTAGLPALERPGGESLSAVALPSLPPRPARWWQQVPWGLGVLAGLLLLLATAVLWLWRPRPVLGPAELIRDRQARLMRWGSRLGQPQRDGQTAHEYSQNLGRTLEARGRDSRWPQARQASGAAPAEVEHLAQAFVQTQYGRDPIPEREVWAVRKLWTRLRRHLWWLWLAPGFRKGGKPSP